jgi:4'-phosphopantetheinyl transferase
MKINDWKNQLGNPIPANGDCQLWMAWIDEEDPTTFMSLLSSDEKQRAEKLRNSRYSDRFIVGRGILRTLLGNYLSCNPEQLIFSYGSHGKPGLANGMSTGLAFNVSHSDGLAIFAIGIGRGFGVDVEHFHAITDMEATASIFLSPEELSRFEEIPTEEKLDLFFTLWTAKEAVLKAYGGGFSSPLKDVLSNFYISDLELKEQPEVTNKKRLWSFVPAEGFRGALACL